MEKTPATGYVCNGLSPLCTQKTNVFLRKKGHQIIPADPLVFLYSVVVRVRFLPESQNTKFSSTFLTFQILAFGHQKTPEFRGFLSEYLFYIHRMGGISADDPQAIAKLENKLAGLEQVQERMKGVNAYYRRHKSLDGCPILSLEQIEQLKSDMAKSYHLQDKPYPTWMLSNNNAEIRRVRGRIKSLTAHKATHYEGWEFEGGRVEADTGDNRLRVFFDEKPDEGTRAALKGNGFR